MYRRSEQDPHMNSGSSLQSGYAQSNQEDTTAAYSRSSNFQYNVEEYDPEENEIQYSQSEKELERRGYDHEQSMRSTTEDFQSMGGGPYQAHNGSGQRWGMLRGEQGTRHQDDLATPGVSPGVHPIDPPGVGPNADRMQPPQRLELAGIGRHGSVYYRAPPSSRRAPGSRQQMTSFQESEEDQMQAVGSEKRFPLGNAQDTTRMGMHHGNVSDMQGSPDHRRAEAGVNTPHQSGAADSQGRFSNLGCEAERAGHHVGQLAQDALSHLGGGDAQRVRMSQRPGVGGPSMSHHEPHSGSMQSAPGHAPSQATPATQHGSATGPGHMAAPGGQNRGGPQHPSSRDNTARASPSSPHGAQPRTSGGQHHDGTHSPSNSSGPGHHVVAPSKASPRTNAGGGSRPRQPSPSPRSSSHKPTAPSAPKSNQHQHQDRAHYTTPGAPTHGSGSSGNSVPRKPVPSTGDHGATANKQPSHDRRAQPPHDPKATPRNARSPDPGRPDKAARSASSAPRGQATRQGDRPTSRRTSDGSRGDASARSQTKATGASDARNASKASSERQTSKSARVSTKKQTSGANALGKSGSDRNPKSKEPLNGETLFKSLMHGEVPHNLDSAEGAEAFVELFIASAKAIGEAFFDPKALQKGPGKARSVEAEVTRLLHESRGFGRMSGKAQRS